MHVYTLEICKISRKYKTVRLEQKTSDSMFWFVAAGPRVSLIIPGYEQLSGYKEN